MVTLVIEVKSGKGKNIPPRKEKQSVSKYSVVFDY